MAFKPTFPDDWLPGSGEDTEGFPYFILNPFAGESTEEIVKTREHRMVGNERKTIYRETSADLVKTADGGNVEDGLTAAMEAAEEAASKMPDVPTYSIEFYPSIIRNSRLISGQMEYWWEATKEPLLVWLGSREHPYIYATDRDMYGDNRLSYEDLDALTTTHFAGEARDGFYECFASPELYPVRCNMNWTDMPGNRAGSEFAGPMPLKPSFLYDIVDEGYYELLVLMPDGNMYSYYTSEYTGE